MDRDPRAMLVLGEIRTCLLHNSAPLPRAVVTQLLGLVPGQRVLSADRPVRRAVSPGLSIGVDCRLATDSTVKARGVGTVGSHAVVTGGMVLQSSALTRVERAPSDHREVWSYYAERSHAIDLLGPAEPEDLVTGFLADDLPETTLDLGAITARLVGAVQMRPQLDHVAALRVRPTRVRWAARVEEVETPRARVHSRDDVIRIVELTVREQELDLAVQFCEDFALHDWLLTALAQAIEVAERAKGQDAEPIEILGPAVEQLLHLWMPGAHVEGQLRELWDALERHPGFTRQWNAQVARIRDWVALRTLHELQRVRHSSTSW